MKILDIVFRVLLALVLLMPVLGTLGVFPPATADLYSPAGWAFMSALIETGYMLPLIGILCGICLILVAINRTALAAIILLPFSTNVVLFHAFVDRNGWASASLGIALFVLNLYFLWRNRVQYGLLW